MKRRKNLRKATFIKTRRQQILVALIFAAMGVIALALVRAAPFTVIIDPENGQVSGNAVVQNDGAAGGGKYVRFQDGTTNPDPNGNTYVKGLAIPKSGTLLGIFSDPNQGISATVPVLEGNIGRKFDMRMRFFTTGALTGQLNNIKNDIAGTSQLQVISWEPSEGWPSDGTITNVANALKSTKPVMLRYAHEMNGNWYAWSQGGNSTEAYKTNWRKAYNIFKTAAPNVIFNWAPFGYNIGGKSYDQYYPGDEYVDVVGIDLYVENPGSTMSGSVGGSVFGGIYNTYSGKKPFMIMETNSGPRKPKPYYSNKTAYYNDFIGFLKQYPRVSGVVFFDENKWAHPEGTDMSIADTYNGGDNTANMNAFVNMAKNCHMGSTTRQAACRGQ